MRSQVPTGLGPGLSNVIVNVTVCKMDGDSADVHGKRRRNEKEWSANVRKKHRAEGKECISRRDKVVEPRKTGNKCRYSRV